MAELVDAPDLKSVTFGSIVTGKQRSIVTGKHEFMERLDMMSLPTDYQTFIATSRYARWLDSENRREYWPETVSRYIEFMDQHLRVNNNYKMSAELKAELLDAIIGLEVMPSMRVIVLMSLWKG